MKDNDVLTQLNSPYDNSPLCKVIGAIIFAFMILVISMLNAFNFTQEAEFTYRNLLIVAMSIYPIVLYMRTFAIYDAYDEDLWVDSMANLALIAFSIAFFASAHSSNAQLNVAEIILASYLIVYALAMFILHTIDHFTLSFNAYRTIVKCILVISLVVFLIAVSYTLYNWMTLLPTLICMIMAVLHYIVLASTKAILLCRALSLTDEKDDVAKAKIDENIDNKDAENAMLKQQLAETSAKLDALTEKLNELMESKSFNSKPSNGIMMIDEPDDI